MGPKRTKMASKIKPKCAQGEPSDDIVAPTYPWPREEGTEISLSDPNIPDSSEDQWDKEASHRYNALLTSHILPTRFVNARAFSNLGLHEDLHGVLQVLGIAELFYVTQPLYPDLVRQVLATAEFTFQKPDFPIFEEAHFTFFASGVKHSISLEKIAEIFEMSEDLTGIAFPKKFNPEQAFWNFIASGEFKSRSANQSHIRNPVLRIAAKVLSNLLFSKDQTSKVHKGELQMLFAGVADELTTANVGIPISQMTTNPACVLVQMFVDKRARVLKNTLKKDRSGSVLTSLFRHLELDLCTYKCNNGPEYIDIPYLINCQILADETTYSFLDRNGNSLFCKLPQPSITTLCDVVNISFVPDPQYLCADPRAPSPDAKMEDVEFMGTTEGSDVFDLGPLDDRADDATYRRWMVDSQRKNNSLMKRILKALTGGCVGAPSTTDPQKATASGHREGKEPAGVSETVPRRRNRRYAGQSDSDGTD